MGKSKVNHETDQTHKRHCSKSDKLKAKHTAKKNRRKIKDERSQSKLKKKEKDKLRKLKLASEAFANKVSSDDIHDVKKIISKLIKHNYDSVKELPQLFEMLDSGVKVDISGLVDSYVM